MAPMEAWDTSIPAIRQACLQQLLGNGRIPWFDERHEITQKDKKAPIGRIPTATSDCYSLHHRPTEPEKQQQRTNQMGAWKQAGIPVPTRFHLQQPSVQVNQLALDHAWICESLALASSIRCIYNLIDLVDVQFAGAVCKLQLTLKQLTKQLQIWGQFFDNFRSRSKPCTSYEVISFHCDLI